MLQSHRNYIDFVVSLLEEIQGLHSVLVSPALNLVASYSACLCCPGLVFGVQQFSKIRLFCVSFYGADWAVLSVWDTIYQSDGWQEKRGERKLLWCTSTADRSTTVYWIIADLYHHCPRSAAFIPQLMCTEGPGTHYFEVVLFNNAVARGKGN